MVTVTSYAERQRKDGTTFITLELTGGVELVQSQTNGRHYSIFPNFNVSLQSCDLRLYPDVEFGIIVSKHAQIAICYC
jgi:hypothetical protein